MFSGYDAKTRKYDKSKWSYKLDEEGNDPLKDPTLQESTMCIPINEKTL